jgi:hypothetical protein
MRIYSMTRDMLRSSEEVWGVVMRAGGILVEELNEDMFDGLSKGLAW